MSLIEAFLCNKKKQIKANNNRMIAVRIKPIIFKKTTCLVLFFRRK
jgi:hypothetical protein